MNRVNTPFGPATVTEVIDNMIQVELDNPYRFNNRDYFLWVFNELELTEI